MFNSLFQETADYTNVQELKYLEMVICESLRLYPPAFRYDSHYFITGSDTLVLGIELAACTFSPE